MALELTDSCNAGVAAGARTLLVAAALVASFLNASALANADKQPISIEDLATITRIRNASVSPDGRWVSYLTIKPLLEENRLDCTVWLQSTGDDAKAVELARFRTTAQQAYLDTGVLKNFGGQSAWSPNSSKLVYTSRIDDKVQVRLRELSGGDIALGAPYPEIELREWSDDGTMILFRTTEEVPGSSDPEDPSLLVTDEQSFWSSSWAKRSSARKTRTFRYEVGSRRLSEASTDGAEEPELLPRTYKDANWSTPSDTIKHVTRALRSPDEKYAAFTGSGVYENRDSRKASRDCFVGVKRLGDDTPPKEFLHSPHCIHSLHWNEDSTVVRGILLDAERTALMAIAPESGKVREVARTKMSLWDASWDRNGTSFVAVGQSTFMPDMLIRFDSITGKFDVLAKPNAAFADKDLPTVRFMRVNNPLGGGIFGRLVLPNGYVKGRRYPLIFTTYRAGTNFLEGAVGGEFPIFPYAAHGFVVFAMDTGTSNIVSDSGDHDFTLMRVRRPIDAMLTLRKQLTAESIVDPENCGITGLSYGADIAVHAVATTNVFKAASVPTSWHDPNGNTLASVAFTKTLEERGLVYPDDIGRETYKKMSIALNAARVMTPLMIQSAETEAMVSLETFKALKRFGVPVDWYIYLDEGHVKFQPRTKYLVYQRNLDWFRFWLQDYEDPDPAKSDQYLRWRKLRETWQAKQ